MLSSTRYLVFSVQWALRESYGYKKSFETICYCLYEKTHPL